MLRSIIGRATLATVLLLPGTASAQGAFQGSVTYRMQLEGMSVTMTMRSKGAKTRTDMEMPGVPGGMFMVMDSDSMTMQTVMPEMGMYMSIDMRTMMESASSMLPMDSLRNAVASTTIDSLGTTDTVAGIACLNYRVHTGAEQMEMCVAPGMGNLGGGAGAVEGSIPGLGLDQSAWTKEFPNGMLPLRMKTLKNGAWETTMEAIAIDRSPIDDAIFAIPPGLTRVDPPSQ